VSGLWSGLDWARPEWLAALGLVPLAILAIIWLGRRRSRVLDVFSEATVRQRTQRLPGGRRAARAAVLVIGFAALTLAAAGPRWGTETVERPPVGQQIVFALDVSRSMLARDAAAAESRLDRSKRVIRQILAGLPAAEAGLVVFAGEASLVVPLTRDTPAIELYLASVGPNWISDPSTDLANAIATSVDAYGPAPGPGRAIVLLTDGEDQAGGVEGSVAAASEREIVVETVGVGSEEGARIPLGEGWLMAAGEEVVTRLEPEPLEALAAATGGEYVALSESDPGITGLLARLRQLDTAREAGESGEKKADRYRWPLALAVLCLAAEVGLRLGSRPGRESSAPLAASALLAGLTLVAIGCAPGPEEMYEEGRYEEALEIWREADRSTGATPADAYNRGNAAYRLGRWREAGAGHAVAARTAESPDRAAEAWYNAGNARYRMAEEAEEESPDEDGQRRWDIAVDAYAEALIPDPDDLDTKHNLELALRRRNEAGGGGGGGGEGGGGESADGGGGGAGGMQPPSTGGGQAPRGMTRSEAERLLDALAAREREALERGEEERRAGQRQRPGW